MALGKGTNFGRCIEVMGLHLLALPTANSAALSWLRLRRASRVDQ